MFFENYLFLDMSIIKKQSGNEGSERRQRLLLLTTEKVSLDLNKGNWHTFTNPSLIAWATPALPAYSENPLHTKPKNKTTDHQHNHKKPRTTMLHYAIIIATLALGAFAGDRDEASLTAKGPTDFDCKGPDVGQDVHLDQYNYTSKDYECIPFSPPKGSNVFVTFGYPITSSIDVFSDDNCKTLAAKTLSLGVDINNPPQDSSEVTKCVLMETAGWADWKSAKLNWS